MRKFTDALVNFMRREDGLTSREYAAILACTLLLIMVGLVATTTLGTNSNKTFTAVGTAIGTLSKSAPDRTPAAQREAAHEFVAAQDQGAPEPAEKKEKPRKIRYTADMKLIVEKIDDADEALDAARKEAKGEYEKVEINRSANVVRSGTLRVRVPINNLNSFRKAVAKIGDVERDTIDSEDMTSKYYDLEIHIKNRKAEQTAVREFLVEIGKKDPRFMDVRRELNQISDDINRKEGMFKLWTELTDLTTFTIHLREKEPYTAPVVKTKEDPPSFGDRAGTSWDESWGVFLAFCQRVVIVAIWVAPWLPIALVGLGCVWLCARRLGRAAKAPVVLAVVEENKKS